MVNYGIPLVGEWFFFTHPEGGEGVRATERFFSAFWRFDKKVYRYQLNGA